MFLGLCESLPSQRPVEGSTEDLAAIALGREIVQQIVSTAISSDHPCFYELSIVRQRAEKVHYMALKKLAQRFDEFLGCEKTYFNPEFMERIFHPNTGCRYVVQKDKRLPWSYLRILDTDYAIIEKKDHRLWATEAEAIRRSQNVLARANKPEALSFVPYTSLPPVTSEIKVEGTSIVGMASSQGIRPSMEDVMGYASFYHIKSDGESVPVHLQWVMDGHCGPNCARLSGHYLLTFFRKNLERHASTVLDDVTISNAMLHTAVEVDHAFAIGTVGYDGSGSTACWAVVIGRKIYTANTGDSRAILVTRETVKALSCDQKPDNLREELHIKRRGGAITRDHVGAKRVMGNIAMTRSFGDHGEEGVLSPRPEITIMTLEGGEKLVLACDGLWDVVSTNDAALCARDGDASAIANRLVEMAFERGTRDNISVAVFDLDRVDEREFLLAEEVDSEEITCIENIRGLAVEDMVDEWKKLFYLMNRLQVERSDYDNRCREARGWFLAYRRQPALLLTLYLRMTEDYCSMYSRFLTQCSNKALEQTLTVTDLNDTVVTSERVDHSTDRPLGFDV